MEDQGQHLKPSTQFIKRGAIAIGIVALILIVQTAWFQRLVFKREKPHVVVSSTVGDVVGKDSNANGIPDWEEKLWGLDPTVLYTNGIPNAQIIEQKKKSLGLTTSDSAPVNDTDKLARDLFTLTAALGQSDEVDSQTLQEIATKLGNSVNIKQVNNQYSLKDVRTVPTSTASIRSYHDTMRTVFTRYNLQTPDIEVLVTALQDEDASGLSALEQSTTAYRSVAKDLIALKVPAGIAQEHLALVNSFAGIATSFTYMTQLNENSIVSLVGVAVYRNYSTKLNNATSTINDYFTQYGIL